MSIRINDNCEDLEWKPDINSIQMTKLIAASKYRSLIIFVGFDLMWMIFCLSFWLGSSLKFLIYHASDYIYFLLLLTSLFKLLLKKIARKIDTRTININYTPVIIKQVSLELLIELVFDMIYFTNYYFYFIFELSKVSIITLLSRIVLIHIFTEIIQSTVRFSKIYFNLALKVQKYLKSETSNYISRVLLRLIKDESNFDEWRIRQSVDMSLRIFSSIISFILNIIYTFGAGYQVWNRHGFFKNKHDFHSGIFYGCLAFVIDIVYFLLVFLINYNTFNIWKPFLSIFSANGKIIVSVFVIASAFAQFSLFA